MNRTTNERVIPRNSMPINTRRDTDLHSRLYDQLINGYKRIRIGEDYDGDSRGRNEDAYVHTNMNRRDAYTLKTEYDDERERNDRYMQISERARNNEPIYYRESPRSIDDYQKTMIQQQASTAQYGNTATPAGGVIDNYIIVDSRYRDRSYKINDRILFRIVNNSNSDFTTGGNIQVNYPLTGIIEMAIMGDVQLPSDEAKDVYDANAARPITSLDMDIASMEIIELNKHAYNLPNNKFTHFMMQRSPGNTGLAMYKFTPLHKVTFIQPINTDSLSLRFYNQNGLLPLPDDVYECVIKYDVSPVQLIVVSTATGEVPIGHGLTADDYVAFENFTATGISADDASQPTYRDNFYQVTPIASNHQNSLTFTLPFNFTTAPLALSTDVNRIGDVNRPSYNPVKYGSVSYPVNNGQTTLIFTTEHGYKPGDTIVFTSFPTISSLQTTLTRPQGWTVVNSVAHTVFQLVIDIDVTVGTTTQTRPNNFTAMASPRELPGRLSTVRIYVGSRRMQFAMRFRTVSNKATNNIVAI